jgi:membrane-associated phospholipid phosphatase
VKTQPDRHSIPATTLLLLVPAASAQFRDETAGPVRLAEHVYEAVNDVAGWYDAPLFLIYLVDKYDFIPQNAKPIILSPTGAEQIIALEVGVLSSSSPGSLEPFTIPNIIVGLRAIHSIGSELFDDEADARPALRHTIGLYKALMYTQISTQLSKNVVYRARPDLSDSKSFFSGHTSTSFAMASYLQREIDDALLRWNALADNALLRNMLRAANLAVLYGWGSYVGYSRMRDNRHYLGDVLVGAVIGTFFGNLVYDQVVRNETGVLSGLGIAAGADGPQLSLRYHF